MKTKELIKRYLLLTVGLLITAIGVGFAKKAALGVSPISSVANILSMKFTAITMGNWLIIWNCLLIVAQIVILRKKFPKIQLLQFPLSFIFGYFTDFGIWCVSGIPVNNYLTQIVLVFVGILFVGFGTTLSVTANVVLNAGEGFVKAVADTLNKNFGNVKVVFDISSVSLSLILSLIFFDFTIQGAREGTILAAVCVGFVVKFFSARIKKPLDDLMKK